MAWGVAAASEDAMASSGTQWNTVALFVSTALFTASALALWVRYASKASSNNGATKSSGGSADAKKAETNGVHENGNGHLPPARTVSVLFGTQTGTAERFSEQLAEEINDRYGAHRVTARALDIETYDHQASLKQEDVALFCVATYGDGEPTDSALNFTEWLGSLVKESDVDGSAPLEMLKYGVFALGNTQYEHFCACGKLVDRQLKALGAKAVVERGDGDDDANIEDDFAAWKEKLWPKLDVILIDRDLSPASANGNGMANGAVKKKVEKEYDVQVLAASQASKDLWGGAAAGAGGAQASAAMPILATVTERKELHTKASERSCIHAEIDIAGTGVTYETGDHVGVYAANPPELVSAALKRLDYDGKQVVRLTAKAGCKLPETIFEGKPVTVRDLFSHFLDIQSPPRKDALLALSQCATEEKEGRKLAFLASKEGKEEYSAYILDDMRSLLEVLESFPSCKPTLGVFAARVATKLQPRFYSISSSPLAHPASIHITCSVVQGKSPTGRDHKGVAGTWFSRSKVDGTSRVAIFVRRSNFKLPAEAETPIVMVGPGTGFAPFRGFLQERSEQRKMAAAQRQGAAHLYYGCRSQAKDFIYKDEIEAWKDDSVITDIEYAFSRDQAQKVYVQDRLRANGRQIYDLLFETSGPKACFYVCGDAKAMARGVNKCLHEIIQEHGSCSASVAEGKIKTLQDEGRYMRDVW
mmetsp:Transcript_18199/g.37609  ORF Transcript_18199/g.37609 Transcript_18199/m.37609 type:complete len:703 (+) Transcript_18199:166-2274(+)